MDWIDFDKIKAGDRLIADGGFPCIIPAQVCTVLQDEKGLYVPCFGPGDAAETQSHHHYLDGQVEEDGKCIGFTREAALQPV